MATERSIEIRVNGEVYRRTIEARKRLGDFLREDLELTGTHLACEHGVCGVCTVLIDDTVQNLGGLMRHGETGDGPIAQQSCDRC
jgi:aerobic-type carbon monoxide dehydrogenase small subunit (CoxS/CutS family)